MTEIAQRLTMGSNVSAPVVLSKIRAHNLFPLEDVTMLFCGVAQAWA